MGQEIGQPKIEEILSQFFSILLFLTNTIIHLYRVKKLYIFLLVSFISLHLLAKEDDKSFSLWPVPVTSDVLTVKITTHTNIASFEIRNLVGRKLQEKKYNGEEELVFTDMSSYYDGIYVVVARDANGKIVETLKFTIDR